MKTFLKTLKWVCGLGLILSAPFAYANLGQDWMQSASELQAVVSQAGRSSDCIETSFENLSTRYVVGKTDQGKPCAVYDLSFPTLEGIFTSAPVATLRVKKPSFSDYKVFLDDRASMDRAERFLGESFSAKDLKASWYGKLKFKNSSRMIRNSDGIVETFQFKDLVSSNKNMGFTQKEKKVLLSLLNFYGRSEGNQIRDFVENPRGILDGITFKYDSLKKAYQVFIDLEFLPIRGPIKLVDHHLQYRGLLQKQIRSLILSALNRLVDSISPTLTGRILKVVLNDAFELLEQTYSFQKLQLDQFLRMGLEQEIELKSSKKELKDHLYLLYVQDSQALIPILTKAAQTGEVNLDSLYAYGKGPALQSYQARLSASDKNFSKLYYELSCSLEGVAYFFAHCKNQGNLYSLISDIQIFFWNFGNPKVLNLDSPWEVFTKRVAAYLLAGAVDINFLSFPEWLSSQVSSALKTYAFAGVQDEALVLSKLYERKARGERLSAFEDGALENLISKNILPFLPKSEQGLNRMIQKHRVLLNKSLN